MGTMEIRLDLAAGEHRVYGRSVWDMIIEATAAGEVIRIGTRVVVTFDPDLRDRIATLEVAKGEDTLLMGAWSWM